MLTCAMFLYANWIMKLKQTLLGFAASLATTAVFAAPADEIKSLLEQNNAAAAYEQGRAAPGELGNPLFDFYFGIAAIDSGHPGEGVLALERYILTFPNNADARFHLARGYFILGEDQRARDEFETLSTGASEKMKVAIDQYLTAIRSREARYQPTATYFLEAGLGWDSNLNAGLNSGSTVSIAGLGNLAGTVQGNSISAKEGDWFTSVSGGAQGTWPLEPGLSLFGSVGFDNRSFLDSQNDVFDQFSVAGNGGVALLKDKHLFKASVTALQMNIDNQSYLWLYGLNGEWNYQLDQFDRFTLAGQLAKFDFKDIDVYQFKDKSGGKIDSGASARDSYLYSISGIWTHAFSLPYQPVLTGTVNYAQEDNRHDFDAPLRDIYSRDLYGARVGLTLRPDQRWGLSGAVGYHEAKHDKPFLPGSDKRADDIWTGDVSVSYFYNKEWTIRGEYAFTDQRSNIGLYEYKRNIAAVKVRYDFH